MWIVRLALRRPYTVATLCLLIFIAGGLSLWRVRADVLPQIDIPVVIVVWNYPGLSASDMEKRVTFITERAFSTTVSGISRIESESISGLALIRVYFEQGTDIGSAIAQISSVSNTLLRILPPGMTAPVVVRFNASNVPVAQLTVSGKDVSEQQLFDYGLNFLRVRLFTIPGLATPAPFGGRQRQVMVDVDPMKAAAKGLAPQDVVEAVLASNVIIPAGTARIGTTEYDVQLNSSPERIADFNAMPLKIINGAPVLLGDVAHVHDGYAVQTNIARVNGRRATYLSILKKVNASTLQVVNAVKQALPEIQKTAPNGVQLKLDFDQSIFVRAAVTGVLREAVIAALLVSLMVLFFLGSWRSMLVVSTSIPLSAMVSVVGLFLTGQTLNLMTLGGLALAIGMLVDDATVEVENIHRNRALGKKLTIAILDGARQVAVPALAATLTICIVFFPVVLLDVPARFLFTPLALAVVFAMLASYLLSRTLVPTLVRKLTKGERHDARPSRFNAWRDRRFEQLRDGYGRALKGVLDHRPLVLVAGLLLTVVALFLVRVVGLDFFPQVDAGQMRLHFRAPIGTRLEQTENLVAQVEDTVRELVPERDLETVNANIGVPISYNLAFVQTDNIGSQDAELLVMLKRGHKPTVGYQTKLREELPKRFPGSVFYFQSADLVSQVLNFGLSSPIDVQIEGRDTAKSFELARALKAELELIPGTVDVRIQQVTDKPALRVSVDRQRAALVGLTERDVASNMLTSLSSSTLVNPSYWVSPENGVNYPVVVQTPIDRVRSVPDLLATPVGTAASAQLATSPYLGSLSQLRPTETVASVSHYTVQPIVEVQVGVEGRDLGAVAGDIQRAVKQHALPPGTSINVRGQSESMTKSFTRLGLGLILAIALVYLLLVVLFQSWLDPFIIMVAVPGALVGVLWMLAVTGTTLNVESFMGAIMAVGIAVSNSILLVSFANEVRVEKGLDVLAAAVEAGRTRLRPVIMTALAMVLGMLPTSLGLGEGGEQNAPLGRAVIGGLLVATFVTLFMVPLVYTALRKAPPTAHELDVELERESTPDAEPAPAQGPVP
jgi:CzcA family heavy metal efflux pump